MPTPIENSLQDLIARISAGEPVDPASIPPELGDDPTLKRLLQLARVAEVFDRNFEIGRWRRMPRLRNSARGDCCV